MICIAESGSTKTTWVTFDARGREIDRSQSIGLNPFFVSSDEVAHMASEVFAQIGNEKISTVHFYGASCSSEARNKIIADGLKEVLPNAQIFVNHDLLAAARATCKSKAGIACILGTGSNSCAYDGLDIVDNVPALGYALGDEGSGTAFGRRLLQGWLYREMPPEIEKAFNETYNTDKEEVLINTYNKPKPNRYLASFAKFYSDYRTHRYIQNIIMEVLQDFVDRHVVKYELAKSVEINFVGSIAFSFRDELSRCLQQRGLRLGLVIKAPIDELCKYHIES
jgi:N-acetylglucosamine kinase-like BadF-type ATPase